MKEESECVHFRIKIIQTAIATYAGTKKTPA
jgi:hypothetical protein